MVVGIDNRYLIDSNIHDTTFFNCQTSDFFIGEFVVRRIDRSEASISGTLSSLSLGIIHFIFQRNS